VPRPKPKPAANGAAPATRRLVSKQAAAVAYDVDPKTVSRWIARGLIRGYRVGGRLVKVDLNEIEATVVEVMPAAGPPSAPPGLTA